jgi:hypothetical protein
MNARSATEVLGYGIVLPAGIALAVVLLVRRTTPAGLARHSAAALGFAAGFFAGYALLPSWAELVPSRHWHWLPYLTAAATLIGPIGLTEGGVSRAMRGLLQLAIAGAAAWLLVPTWATLTPPRLVSVALLASYLVLLMVLLDHLPLGTVGRRFPVLLCAAACVTAALIAYAVSVTYGRVAGLAAAALAGICVAAWLRFDAAELRGLIPAFAVAVGGAAYVACIDPQPPQLGLLLAPAAPLGLWVCAFGPLARLRGPSAAAVQTSAVAVPLIAAIIAVYSGSAEGY